MDHGKTALVARLTGVDTDRLPEEKARGLSIVLGYAPLRLPSGRSVSIVDVPGHERFVRTMVAGATGVDAFLMVVAADDGVMPQTREHAEVLKALDVRRGVIAITKSDIADPARARREVEELLPGIPALACSASTGHGLAELTDALDRLVGSLPSRAAAEGNARLHIDRVFTVKGRGTVVTGTLWSGSVAAGQELEVVPRAVQAHVRSVQVHGREVTEAAAGQRVAVNLRGVRAGEVQRGDALAEPGALRERTVLDCALELRGARHGQRVQVHHGTRDVPARLCELGGGEWQLRLERPLLACDGDRLVVRRHAPAETLGGGVVLDAAARRHGRRRSTPGPAPAGESRPPQEGTAISEHALAEVERRLRDAGTGLRSEAQLSQERPDAAEALRALRAAGRAVRVSGRLYAHADVVAEVRASLVRLLEQRGSATLAQARDELGVGRKAAQAFLEHLDARGVTRRMPDDRRVLAEQPAMKNRHDATMDTPQGMAP